ncbi:MAG: hypothetical protein AAF616_01635 [Bacteroidota bacterium]
MKKVYRLLFTIYLLIHGLFAPAQFTYQSIDSIDWITIISQELTASQDILQSSQAEKTLESKSDTLSRIKILLRKGQEYTNTVNFSKAYDEYWRALGLTSTEDSEELAICYQGLGILYSIFQKDKKAFQNFQRSIQIRKSLQTSDMQSISLLASSYFHLAVHFRYAGNPDLAKAKIYLDSSILISQKAQKRTFVSLAEEAYINGTLYGLNQVYETLQDLEINFIQTNPEYLTIFYFELGKLHYQNADYTTANQYLVKSILNAYRERTNLNFLPLIYETLAEICQKQAALSEAVSYLKVQNRLNQLLYDSRSPNNEFLLEIKDQFRVEQEELAKQKDRQRLDQLEKEQAILQLRVSVLVISILFILTIVFIWIRKVKREQQRKERAAEQNRLLENQKNKEMVDIKNRELTNSTLRLIAKDELLERIKDEMSEAAKTIDSSRLKKLVKSIEIDQNVTWLEFENRFTAVNKGFFDRMKEKYSDLSDYDMKICSLIKLKFSGKEMARLLGISPESANTSRYRLRKKLGLDKEQNLNEFIQHF